MPNSSSRHRVPWLILIGLALLALIPFAIHRADHPDEKNPSSNSKKTTHRGNASFPDSPARTISSRGSGSRILPPSHESGDLKNFLLPQSELRDVTLEDALDILFSQYREICQETGENPITFRIKIEGSAEPIVFAKIEGDFLSTLRHLAVMAGTTVEVDGHDLLFTEIKDGPIVQRRWTVPPTFSRKILGIPIPDDPFENPSKETRNIHSEPFKEIGVIKSNETVSLLPNSSTLIARAGRKSMHRLDSMVGVAASNGQVQTRIRFVDEKNPQIPAVIIPEIPHPTNLVLLTGQPGTIERHFSEKKPGNSFQLIATSTEQGFGRKIETVTITGDFPTAEASALYRETGNPADLGVGENYTTATYRLNRANAGEPQILTYHDANGDLAEKTFIAERIDATLRTLPSPE